MSFTFVLLVAPQEYIAVLYPFHVGLLTAGAGLAACLFGRFIRGQSFVTLTRETVIIVCLAAWAVATVPLSFWPGGSVSFLLDYYFKILLLFWLLIQVTNTVPRLRKMAWGLSLMVVPAAATGVNQYLSGDPSQGRIQGTLASLTGNPNDLALMVNLVLPLCVALLLIHRRISVRLVLLGLITLNVTTTVVSFSRGGFLTLVTIVTMYFFKFRGRRERRWLVAAAVIALMCVPLLPAGYSDRLATIADKETDPTGSAQDRWSSMAAALRLMIGSPIVGSGVGMNHAVLTEEGAPAWATVHNVYLQLGVDLGVPGLILYLLLLVTSLKAVRFVRQRTAEIPASRELYHLAEGLEVSLTAFVVASMFHPIAYHLYFYYLGGLAFAVHHVYEAEEDSAPAGSSPNFPVKSPHGSPRSYHQRVWK